MAYENLKLVVAGLSGEIYLAKTIKGGHMSDTRRIATEDCLRATTEWFMRNKKKMINYESIHKGQKPHLFYTDDEAKAEKILEILQDS